MRELVQKYQDVSGYQIAEAYGYRGDREHTLQWLERAYDERDSALVGVKTDPLLNSMHEDPRYAEFLKKMRLPLN